MTTHGAARKIARRIRNQNKNIIKGLLIPCHSATPVIVPIPIIDELPLPCHIDGLDTAHWIRTDDGANPPYLLDRTPGGPVDNVLISKFYIYSHKQLQGPATAAINGIMTKLGPLNGPWYGDILVVKLQGDWVTNIDVQDVALVKQLLVWAIGHNIIPSNRLALR